MPSSTIPLILFNRTTFFYQLLRDFSLYRFPLLQLLFLLLLPFLILLPFGLLAGLKLFGVGLPALFGIIKIYHHKVAIKIALKSEFFIGNIREIMFVNSFEVDISLDVS